MTRDSAQVRALVAVTPHAVLAEYEAVVREAGYEPGAVLPSTLCALAAVPDGTDALLINQSSSASPPQSPGRTKSCCTALSIYPDTDLPRIPSTPLTTSSRLSPSPLPILRIRSAPRSSRSSTSALEARQSLTPPSANPAGHQPTSASATSSTHPCLEP